MIVNFPGSKKAVVESFDAIKDLIPHAIELICDQRNKTEVTHNEIQNPPTAKHEAFNIPQHFESFKHEEILKEAPKVTPVKDEAENIRKSSPRSFDSFSTTSGVSTDIESSDEIVAKYIQSMKADQNVPNTPKNVREPPKVVSTPSSSDISEMLEISSRSSVIEEFIIDESLAPTPKKHSCPHKTAKADDKFDRNSPFPMIEVENALQLVFSNVKKVTEQVEYRSPMNCPPFRASIKDGYAIKASATSRVLKVIGFVNAGDKIVQEDFNSNECYKINTGAAVPAFADAILQVEDTKLIKSENGVELEIEVLKMPRKDCDIRKVGSDIAKNELLFTTNGLMDVAEKTLLASVGLSASQRKPKIAIISTGDELVDPTTGEIREGQIYDSNTTMLKLLCEKYGFDVKITRIAKDEYDSLKGIVVEAMEKCDVVVSSGGVSMGDKDFVKKLLVELGFEIHFGRVNMKPGKKYN